MRHCTEHNTSTSYPFASPWPRCLTDRASKYIVCYYFPSPFVRHVRQVVGWKRLPEAFSERLLHVSRSSNTSTRVCSPPGPGEGQGDNISVHDDADKVSRQAFIYPLLLPVTTPAQQIRQVLEIFPIQIIKSILNRAINVNNSHHLFHPTAPSAGKNRHHNLALAVTVAGNVAWELVHVGYQLRLLRSCSGTADSTAKFDCLAGNFPLEGSEDELRFRRRGVKNVEACIQCYKCLFSIFGYVSSEGLGLHTRPVYFLTWRRKGPVGVPQQ